MSWKDKVVSLYKRIGTPAKFAAKLVLGAVVPGGSAVVELVGAALDCVHETVRDQIEFDEAKMSAVSAGDLLRLEGVFDILNGDLGALTAQVAAMEQLPQVAARLVDTALATDEHCLAALGKLNGLAKTFNVLREQNSKILIGQRYAEGMQEEMLQLLHRATGVFEFVEEMRAAGLSVADLRVQLTVFRDGERALAQGRIAEAAAWLQEASHSQPQSGTAAAALAAAQAAGQDLAAAEKTLARAVQLRPRDEELGELHRRVTQASRGAERVAGEHVAITAPKVGDLLAGWRLEQMLGRGGWGQVFKASRGVEVRALKVMKPDLSRDPAFVERFKAEILTLAGLRGHEHLVEIHGFGKDIDCWYFLMEFIKGRSLEQYLIKNGPLNAKQALWLFIRLADGLALAHARGVVHRDIKPGNIMLRAPDGAPVLVDFGLASAGDGAVLTETGRSAGCNVMFAAPEQLRARAADARSDVYALAASLFYALNYHRSHLREPDQFEPEHAPEALREALTRALRPKPEQRYANAGALRAALDEATAPPDHPQRKPGEILTNSLGMKFAWIPPGTFLMGSPPNEPGRSEDETQHKVTLTKGFYLGVHPITQAQWLAVTDFNPSNFKEDDLPVECVSWDDGVAFCKALSRKDARTYRLPTEAEWEYACRAGTTTPMHFVGAISVNQANYDGEYTYGAGKKGVNRKTTMPVGSFLANAWNLRDMHGNVWEWCSDSYGPYQKEDMKDPHALFDGDARVVRGGSWYSRPSRCRSACRNKHAPGHRVNVLGCRVALCLD